MLWSQILHEVTPHSDCPTPVFVKDRETESNTHKSMNSEVKSRYTGGTFDLSLAQDPFTKMSVYEAEDNFTFNMIRQSPSTLLARGGDYANTREPRIECILRVVFPVGIGGPKMKRRVNVSLKACIERCSRTALPRFQQGDAVQVMFHMFARQMSFESGIVIARSEIGTEPMAERLKKLTVQAVKTASNDNIRSLSKNMELLTKSIPTSCRALGHTEQKL